MITVLYEYERIKEYNLVTQINKIKTGHFNTNPPIKKKNSTYFLYFVELNSRMACAKSGVKNHM